MSEERKSELGGLVPLHVSWNAGCAIFSRPVGGVASPTSTFSWNADCGIISGLFRKWRGRLVPLEVS